MAGWKTMKSLAKTELKFRLAVLIVNVLICVIAVVTIGVSVDAYIRQKNLVWQYVEPGVNPPVLVVALACLLLLITATLGCVASIKFELRFLKMYCYALVVEIVATLIVAFLVMFLFGSRQGIEVFDDKFEAGIMNYKTPEASKFMDEAQETLSCCGINGYMDWNRNEQFKCSNDSSMASNCSVPTSCCIESTPTCGLNVLNESYAGDIDEKIFTEGCISAVEDVVQHYAFVVGGLCLVNFAFLAAQAVLIGIYLHMRLSQMSVVSQVADTA